MVSIGKSPIFSSLKRIFDSDPPCSRYTPTVIFTGSDLVIPSFEDLRRPRESSCFWGDKRENKFHDHVLRIRWGSAEQQKTPLRALSCMWWTCTGWPFSLWRTSRLLQNNISALAWLVQAWPGQNRTTGGSPQAEWSPCRWPKRRSLVCERYQPGCLVVAKQNRSTF